MKNKKSEMRRRVKKNCMLYGAHCEAEEPIRYNVSRIIKNLYAVYDLTEQIKTATGENRRDLERYRSISDAAAYEICEAVDANFFVFRQIVRAMRKHGYTSANHVNYWYYADALRRACTKNNHEPFYKHLYDISDV